ncbi:hypothetical protein OPU71_13850 [Niveibacterium sp. 24ML]|uniref:hypothetical protein n=1 Tax=Niveibacterium sp. 24ML TaxID=2985512 RepID=UPI002270318B|nr:hypothetical protein [Niveibacterium sp. 24ML]MCX9157210.1 hypothetical protein [Niveibacterium sp. 24ML]
MKAISFLLLLLIVAFGFWVIRRSFRAIGESQRLASTREAEFLQSAAGRVPTATMGALPTLPIGASLPGASVQAKDTELLEREERLVYLLLRVALPEYEVLVHVGSHKINARARDYGLGVLDFVVCSKDFRPLAIVVLDRAEASSGHPLRSRALAELATCGLKLAHWRTDRLPNRTDVRAWMLDSAVAGERRFAA